MKRNCILCDIDGVLMDSRNWHRYLPTTDKREDWNIFQTYYYVCKPNPTALEIVKNLTTLHNTDLILFTAREDTMFLRHKTRMQIDKYSNGTLVVGTNCKLVMRPLNDFREDSIVKETMLKEFILPYYTPILAIDDNINNIEMFKKYKIDTMHYSIGY